jgi:hypothetical protein
MRNPKAAIVLRKIDAAGRPVRQIELCDRHAQAVILANESAALRSTTAVRWTAMAAGTTDRLWSVDEPPPRCRDRAGRIVILHHVAT